MYPTDKELIKRAKRRDKKAFSAIIDRYSDKIFGYLVRYVGDYQRAEDLTIETFLNAYRRLRTYTEMGKLSSWLYKIATNCAKKEMRKNIRRREVSIEKPVDGEGSVNLQNFIADERSRPDYRARQAELKNLVYKAMTKLGEKYKKALLLCDVEGLAYGEAAKVLKSNPITIGTRVRRARIMLYNVLRKYGYQF